MITGPITLRLVLAHHWFDAIERGTKTIEYRAMSPHWTRLIWNRRDRISAVVFQRGYTKRTLERPVASIDVGPCPYPGWPGNFYRIHLP